MPAKVFPDSEGANLYIPSLATSSLLEFYDDVIFWEIAKNTNKFFVTFEEGNYAIQNNMQESIATMEINYPHLDNNSGSGFTNGSNNGGTRNNVGPKSFYGEDEELLPANSFNHHQYDGFIPLTEIRGTRYWQSTITSSIFKMVSLSYQIMTGSELGSASFTKTVSKEMSASYFYPFSSHQLSVLRKSPTLIVDLDKDTELGDGYTGEKGFVAIPFLTHQKVKDNLDFYLEKAGLIEKTVKFKAPKKGR